MNFVLLPGQLRLALCLCYAGMAAGAVYDVLWPMRRVKGIRQAADMLFGLLAGSLYAWVLTFCRESALRMPGLLFFLMGIGLYAVGPGRMIRFCFHRLFGRKKADERRNEKR